jgi:hydroxybutyrate-dimer hydrolase
LLGPAAAAYAVDDIGGVFGPAAAVGTGAQFAVKSSRELDTFLVTHPDRVAAKHAHSQINPERLWGRLTLRSIEFAFWALNDQLAGQRSGRLNRQNTVVIASGVSAGGETALLALEEDDEHLIDGVVVTEPGISPRAGAFTIQFGSDPPFAPGGRSLYDAFTLMGVYAACAAVSPTLTGTPAFGVQPLGAPGGALQNRCASLKARGLVSGDTLAEQSASALAVLRRDGYAPGQDWGIPFWEVVNIWRSFQQSYSASYGRFALWENVCDVSFGATDATGRPAPIAEAVAKRLFADGTGAPVFGALSLIADGAQNGPIAENQAVSRSTSRADLNLDGALCFRYLATGDRSLLAALDTPSRARADAARARVRQGMREVQATGRLPGPTGVADPGSRGRERLPELATAAVLRAQPGRGRPAQRAPVHRSDAGAARRRQYLHVLPEAGRGSAVRAATFLPAGWARSDVGALDARNRPSSLASRSGRPAGSPAVQRGQCAELATAASARSQRRRPDNVRERRATGTGVT